MIVNHLINGRIILIILLINFSKKNHCKSLDKRQKSGKIEETTRTKVKKSVRHLQ